MLETFLGVIIQDKEGVKPQVAPFFTTSASNQKNL